MDKEALLEKIHAIGLDNDAYLDLMAEQAGLAPAPADSEQAERIEYTKLNLHRTRRIGRTWKCPAELEAAVEAIGHPQVWMVLTEPWCGDSAQCLPVIAALASKNPLVQLRIVLRDVNLDIMDRYLTDGKRSIPRLVAFAADGSVLGQWGPRPRAAQAVFDEAKGAGLEKPDILEKLHLWYGRDRGAAIGEELLEFMRGLGR